jgi:hypothetical protein
MRFAVKLWRDERGITGAMGLLLLVTLVAIGAIVGLATLRDQIVQEMGDMAVALESLDQSYSGGPYGSYTDPPTTLTDPLNAEPACMSVRVAPSNEGM